MVFNLALQYVQNKEDAEEITQDVFVKAHAGLPNFNESSSFKTWIYRIAIHQSLDYIRHRNAQKRSFFSTVFSLNDEKNKIEASDFNHPGIALEQKESYQKLFEAINLLPDPQKTVLILLKIDGQSQAETAEIMQLNVKAVESLFQRAKKNLEKILDNKGKP